MATITRDQHDLIVETIEDSIEYAVHALCSNGELISGQTAWKVASALAEAKLAEFDGKFSEHDLY